mgnify:FL=1
MSHWLDEVIARLEKRSEVSDSMRDRLLALLRMCRYEDNVHRDYEEEILSSELSMARFEELNTTFEMNKLDVRYDYAPSKRKMAAFIRYICDL